MSDAHHDSQPVLQGKRVRLEPLSTRHVEGLRPHLQRQEIWEFLSIIPRDRADGLDEWVAKLVADARAGTSFPYAIVDRMSGAVAGSTSLYDYVPRHKRITIGHSWLGVEHWGHGLNDEAKYLALRHAFETLDVNRVQASVDVLNQRSRRAVEKLSFAEEGVMRSFLVRPNGRASDLALYSLLRSEWPPVKARLEALIADGAEGRVDEP